MSTVPTAVLFPGQGSQEPGMGRDVAEASKEAMELWKKAEQISGLPLRAVYWESDDAALMADTKHLQPALTVVNVTLWQALSGKLSPACAAGHSLGEYSALAAAGALSPESTLELVSLRGENRKEVGFSCKVVLPPTHDTASAVAAVPTQEEETLYISSGTWSLMGTERMTADCSSAARAHNMTNEGGYDCRFRYLKNIMGLWMIQSVRKESAPELGFGEICARAAKETIASRIDVNDARFLAPENMTEEVRRACREAGEQVPQTIGELAAVIYHSLAQCYAGTAEEIEALTGKQYPEIHIVGGGANAQYLNRLTAEYTGKTVEAGPTEATALGNLAVQMIAAGEFEDLSAARACIADSFTMEKFEGEKGETR